LSDDEIKQMLRNHLKNEYDLSNIKNVPESIDFKDWQMEFIKEYINLIFEDISRESILVSSKFWKHCRRCILVLEALATLNPEGPFLGTR
jgi:hypothetical protein